MFPGYMPWDALCYCKSQWLPTYLTAPTCGYWPHVIKRLPGYVACTWNSSWLHTSPSGTARCYAGCHSDLCSLHMYRTLAPWVDSRATLLLNSQKRASWPARWQNWKHSICRRIYLSLEGKTSGTGMHACVLLPRHYKLYWVWYGATFCAVGLTFLMP